jgi:hypothetical protein
MPHLYSFRKGWTDENLARYILSKFSFVANPSTVSDDVGSDFFCTLFKIQGRSGHDYLIPKNSFAIQIKANAKRLDLSGKVDYLSNLELPFLVGVVQREHLKLTIYSGEYVPIFLSQIGAGRIKKLEVELCHKVDLQRYFSKRRKGHYVLSFPKVVELRVGFERDQLKPRVELLSQVCSIIHRNIASRRSQEFLFDLIDHGPPVAVKALRILAGPGSFKVFRDNFLKRLSEVFYNLEWIYLNQPKRFKKREFELFRNLFYQLQDRRDYRRPLSSRPELMHRFDSLEKLVGGRAKN